MGWNRFPKYQEIKTDLTEKVGKLKTISFAILYILILGIIIYYYAQETFTKQIEVSNPSLTQYQSV